MLAMRPNKFQLRVDAPMFSPGRETPSPPSPGATIPTRYYSQRVIDCTLYAGQTSTFIPVRDIGAVDAAPKFQDRIPMLTNAPRYPGEAGLIAHRWAKGLRLGNCEGEARLVEMAAYLVAEEGWFSRYSHTREVFEWDRIPDIERDMAKKEVAANFAKSSVSDIACLLLSTKVSYFEKLHHTGQPYMNGLVEKVYDMGGWRESSFSSLRDSDEHGAKTTTNMIRIIGHWICTHGAFHSWQIAPRVEGASRRIPRLSSALLMSTSNEMSCRLGGAPAGTAQIFNLATAIDKAFLSPYAKYFLRTEAEIIIQERDRVKQNPLKFHSASEWLIGTVKESTYEPSSDFVYKMSAFVHSYLRDNNLAHARVFRNKPLVVDSPLYKLICHDLDRWESNVFTNVPSKLAESVNNSIPYRK